MKRRWLSPASALAVVVALTLVTRPTSPIAEHRRPHDIARIRDNIARGRARVVVIGNSMVGRGVDEGLLRKLLGVPVYRLWRNSMRSAWWYLAVKNVIAPACPCPELVVICFRNTVLTDPARGVSGKYKEGIGQLAAGEEPLLHRLAYFGHLDEFQFLLHRYWSLLQRRDDVKRRAENKVKKHVARRFFDGDLDEDDVDRAIGRLLDDGNMAEDLITAQQAVWEEPTDPRAYDFHERVSDSFLPHIIDVAKREGIKLVLVRLKTRRDAGGETDLGPHPRPDLLRRYIENLRDYAGKHNVPLLDFTDTPHIQLHHFCEHDHLTEIGRKLFTRLMAEALRPHFPG